LFKKITSQIIAQTKPTFNTISFILEQTITAQVTTEMLTFLIDTCHGNVTFEAIKKAIRFGNLEIVKFLCSKHEQIWVGILQLIAVACENGNLDIVKFLESTRKVEIERNASFSDFMPKHVETYLRLAVIGGHTNVFKYFIKEKDAHQSIQSLAFYGKLIEIACLACELGKMEIIRYFIENSLVKLNDVDKENGHSFLYLSSKTGKLEIVKYLVEKGIDLNKTDFVGNSSVWIASAQGQLDVLKYLSEKGANLTKSNNEKQTPLFIALNSGHTEIVTLLLKETSKK